ncbi:MAG: hypothetical protein JWN18_399 [Parcubacteria group bacterium]|nr:hypothetical protein [Parcubacteria group bacterium]
MISRTRILVLVTVSFLLVPAIMWLLLEVLFNPWFIHFIFFGSVVTSVVVACVLSALPLLLSVWYTATQLKRKM